MGAETKIEWCDHTFNPWIGCTKVSPGCANCYAAVNTFTRAQRAHGRELWGPDAARHVTSEAKWREPIRWDAAAKAAGIRRRVFCASMADVFEDRPDLAEPRARLAYVIGKTPNLDWLLLTKRPENIARLWITDVVPPNVWLGTTVEDQERADERIPHLLAVPAAVRFLSVEPLLRAVDLMPYIAGYDANANGVGEPGDYYPLSPSARGVDWVIVGGESGPGARPCSVAWIRDVVLQSREAGVPAFVKQLGARPNDGDEPDPDPSGADEPRWLRLRDPKGGDPSEWPEDLRVREIPIVEPAS